jgi:hypothetical protein
MASRRTPLPAALARPWTWHEVFALVDVDDANDIAKLMRVSRVTVWTLRTRQHAKVPKALLRRFAKLLQSRGMADGRKPPTVEQLVGLWFDGRPATVAHG